MQSCKTETRHIVPPVAVFCHILPRCALAGLCPLTRCRTRTKLLTDYLEKKHHVGCYYALRAGAHCYGGAVIPFDCRGHLQPSRDVRQGRRSDLTGTMPGVPSQRIDGADVAGDLCGDPPLGESHPRAGDREADAAVAY